MKRARTRRWARAVLARVSGFVPFACTGGGDTVISGVGNSGNHVGEIGLLERLARELAGLDDMSKVTDRGPLDAYAVVRAPWRAIRRRPSFCWGSRGITATRKKTRIRTGPPRESRREMRAVGSRVVRLRRP